MKSRTVFGADGVVDERAPPGVGAAVDNGVVTGVVGATVDGVVGTVDDVAGIIEGVVVEPGSGATLLTGEPGRLNELLFAGGVCAPAGSPAAMAVAIANAANEVLFIW